jgi:hypothetical protein
LRRGSIAQTSWSDNSAIAKLLQRSLWLAACFVQRSGETNFRVRNCRIIHLKSRDQLGLLVVFPFATVSVAAVQHGGWDEQQAS